MHPVKSNMFLVCVTVGLVLLASKYRKNVFQSVKHLCQSIKSKSYKQTDNKMGLKIALDKIILADTPEKCDYAIQRIRCNLSNDILGFDCEWANEGPVSLLQLATFNGVCGLFRIGKIGYIPQKLKELLASKRILKVGVASYEDGQKIIADYGCRVCGTLDLRTLAERVNLPSPKSLAAMSLQYLGLEMDKLIEVRCSNWNAGTLTDEQVAYAACDAIASVLIYDQIVQRIKEKYSLWENFVNYIKGVCNKNVNMQFYCLPTGVIDTRFKAQHVQTSVNQKNIKNSNFYKIAGDLKINNVTRKINIPTRNKPLYHNCYLQAPDGEILCTCDRKKAEWYVGKGLGDVIKKEPFTVKLKFEPSGRALGEVGQYYTQIKVNQCVVCGTSDKFIRKNVVPREYRKYFPLVMKAHQSHDILLLCPSCHEISNYHDLQLRRKLADMCDAPLAGPLTHIRNKRATNWKKLHSAVKALRERTTLPDARRKELEHYILECTNKQQVTPILLDVLNKELKNAMISTSLNNDQSKCQSHGLQVVQFFQKREGGLVELERMWREHFLLTMKPKYLPSLWSVRHNQERLTIRQSQNRIEPEDAKVAGLAY
ncbi:Exonuclease 3'-5' domain-containing protein 2 [Habropoda laboriosa]|uniref:Exonuclease 3'-5' domain-containing protein 2 n=1 Tax=Habropoda laboriosa TaxID=597456 RepID=A0A0L7QKL7_9HYME|nr:PREDICTED: exonuclease 3'-5' domain-containing protein 2 [Habropoda laboriosa]KOC59183.1 Exonuclease 3'-5' domain-containing protein 2 [Habropoda laboriosa]